MSAPAPQDHPCLICERWGSFGFDWPELVGTAWVKVTHWYCGEHRHIGAEMKARKDGAK